MTNWLQLEPSAGVLAFRFAAGDVCIRPEPLLHINGYGEMARVPAEMNEAAKRMAAHAQAVSDPALSYRTLRVEHLRGNTLTLADGATLECEDFASALAGCCAVIVALLTIGRRFDDEAKALWASRNALDLLFFETAGWLAIEEITKVFVIDLRDSAKRQRCRLTRRLAPGYDNWALTGQRSLFSLFGESSTPVRLLESCAMVPAMSRSAMYGVRKADKLPAHGHQ